MISESGRFDFWKTITRLLTLSVVAEHVDAWPAFKCLVSNIPATTHSRNRLEYLWFNHIYAHYDQQQKL